MHVTNWMQTSSSSSQKQPSSYSYRTCLFFDKFVQCLVLFLRIQEINMAINQPLKKKTIWNDSIVNYISSSIFKSPVNRDKSHLCACMIPSRSFESPVALASPGLPLLPRTHLNPSTCALPMQSCCYRKTTKEAFLFLAQLTTWHCTGHLPLQRNKVPS